MSATSSVLNVDELAYAINLDKQLLKQMGTICFRRCCAIDFESEKATTKIKIPRTDKRILLRFFSRFCDMLSWLFCYI